MYSRSGEIATELGGYNSYFGTGSDGDAEDAIEAVATAETILGVG